MGHEYVKWANTVYVWSTVLDVFSKLDWTVPIIACSPYSAFVLLSEFFMRAFRTFTQSVSAIHCRNIGRTFSLAPYYLAGATPSLA